MNIIIVGCGKIGKAILKTLTKENHNVTVIDKDNLVVKNISDNFDVISICGNGTSPDLLLNAGVNKTDVFIATTNSDEFNLLSCFIAKTLGAKHLVARVRDEEHNSSDFEQIKSKLGISMTINPELYTAKYLYNLINLPSATKVEKFSTRSFEIVEFLVKEDSPIIDIPLFELRKKFPYNFLVCAILRDNKAIIPYGSDTLKAGDKIGILSTFTETHKILKLMKNEVKPIKDVMIIGASKVSTYLADLLIENKNTVTIIEKEEKRALEISEKFNGELTVVNSDGMNHDVLNEHGISKVDAFVALTGKDEENVLSSIYAKSKNDGKIITKISKEELLDVSENLTLDSIVSPSKIIADVIVSYVRGLQSSGDSNVEVIYTLMNGMIEAVEFSINSEFEFTNVPLKNLKLKKDMIIAGIIRDDKSIIPGGDDVIMPNDKVILITEGQTILDLEDVIKKK